MKTSKNQPDPAFLRYRQAALQLATHLKADPDLKHYASVMAQCGAGRDNLYGPSTGRQPFYCHKRFCPICQYRKVWKWRSTVRHRLARTHDQHSGMRMIYLTLTVRDPPLSELRATVKRMQRAYTKLRATRHWRLNVIGDMRFLEVVPDTVHDDYAHPHFHCILLVRASMWGGKDYLSQERWQAIWAQCLGQEDLPHVHAERVKGLDATALMNEAEARTRYSLKPMLPEDVPAQAWICETIKQLKGLRTVTAGGELRAIASSLTEDDIRTAAPETRELWKQDLQAILNDPDLAWADEESHEDGLNSDPASGSSESDNVNVLCHNNVKNTRR